MMATEALHDEITPSRHVTLDQQRTQSLVEAFRFEVLRPKPQIEGARTRQDSFRIPYVLRSWVCRSSGHEPSITPPLPRRCRSTRQQAASSAKVDNAATWKDYGRSEGANSRLVGKLLDENRGGK